jgi:hypothetical protein
MEDEAGEADETGEADRMEDEGEEESGDDELPAAAV